MVLDGRERNLKKNCCFDMVCDEINTEDQNIRKTKKKKIEATYINPTIRNWKTRDKTIHVSVTTTLLVYLSIFPLLFAAFHLKILFGKRDFHVENVFSTIAIVSELTANWWIGSVLPNPVKGVKRDDGVAPQCPRGRHFLISSS